MARPDSHARIIVSDTGAGIPSEFLSHVFEPFRQADGTITRGQPGLGLGLAIARRLVEMHGGKISAASDGEDQGASFTVTIPIVAVQTTLATAIDSRAVAVSDSESIDAELPNLSGLKILAVDDEADTRFRRGARNMVSGRGCRPKQLPSGPPLFGCSLVLKTRAMISQSRVSLKQRVKIRQVRRAFWS